MKTYKKSTLTGMVKENSWWLCISDKWVVWIPSIAFQLRAIQFGLEGNAKFVDRCTFFWVIESKHDFPWFVYEPAVINIFIVYFPSPVINKKTLKPLAHQITLLPHCISPADTTQVYYKIWISPIVIALLCEVRVGDCSRCVFCEQSVRRPHPIFSSFLRHSFFSGAGTQARWREELVSMTRLFKKWV